MIHIWLKVDKKLQYFIFSILEWLNWSIFVPTAHVVLCFLILWPNICTITIEISPKMRPKRSKVTLRKQIWPVNIVEKNTVPKLLWVITEEVILKNISLQANASNTSVNSAMKNTWCCKDFIGRIFKNSVNLSNCWKLEKTA